MIPAPLDSTVIMTHLVDISMFIIRGLNIDLIVQLFMYIYIYMVKR